MEKRRQKGWKRVDAGKRVVFTKLSARIAKPETRLVAVKMIEKEPRIFILLVAFRLDAFCSQKVQKKPLTVSRLS